MSEQKTSFMAALDGWTDELIVRPLFAAWEDFDGQDSYDLDQTVEMVKHAIRGKVLESYRNGQAAGQRPARPARKEQKYAQAQTR
jgi:hypothetical protein